MKRALEYRPYRDVKPFRAPKGVVSAAICSDSGELASPSCPSTQSDFFIDGTQPVVGCPLHQAAPILVQNPNSALVPMGAAASADRSQAKNPDTPN
jgi:membrane carboxypeptidase/penicillin-binding protein